MQISNKIFCNARFFMLYPYWSHLYISTYLHKNAPMQGIVFQWYLRLLVVTVPCLLDNHWRCALGPVSIVWNPSFHHISHSLEPSWLGEKSRDRSKLDRRLRSNAVESPVNLERANKIAPAVQALRQPHVVAAMFDKKPNTNNKAYIIHHKKPCISVEIHWETICISPVRYLKA